MTDGQWIVSVPGLNPFEFPEGHRKMPLWMPFWADIAGPFTCFGPGQAMGPRRGLLALLHATSTLTALID